MNCTSDEGLVSKSNIPPQPQPMDKTDNNNNVVTTLNLLKVVAQTALELEDMDARWASYCTVCDVMTHASRRTLLEN